MGYTSFGEFVRILRIKKHEVLGDMAEKLGTSIAFLSAVENGRKNIPTGWFDTLVSEYSLDSKDQQELKNAIEESKLQYKIVPKSAGKVQRRAAMVFSRAFDDMDEETALKVIEILNKGDHKA